MSSNPSELNFAAKYRPKTFSEVVGCDNAKAVLTRIALNPSVARSIFLKGSWGSSKTTQSRIFGKAVNCSEFPKTHEVCGKCPGCLEAMAPNSQTYQEFDATRVGNVDAIRELQNSLTILPPKNYTRVVVCDEIHAASNAALNALLKMVEDGIPRTIFVFASTEDILPTLKSRSIVIEINPLPYNLISDHVIKIASKEGIDISKEIADTIAVKSQGHMRDALSLLQLYSLSGEESLRTSYKSVQKLIINLFKKTNTFDEDLKEVLNYPLVDISTSVSRFIIDIYQAEPGSSMSKLSKLGPILFSFFYTPVAQQAIKSEYGIILLFNQLRSKVSSH